MRFIETESRIRLARAGGRENRKLLFHEYRIYVWGDTKILEMDSDDGCTTV